jgi:hypothetical protein
MQTEYCENFHPDLERSPLDLQDLDLNILSASLPLLYIYMLLYDIIYIYHIIYYYIYNLYCDIPSPSPMFNTGYLKPPVRYQPKVLHRKIRWVWVKLGYPKSNQGLLKID